jgi:hypothetical protein
MDPLSVFCGTVGLASVGSQAITSAHEFRGNYRRAANQIQHMQAQERMVQSHLEHETLHSHTKFTALHSSFETIAHSFPGTLRSDTKRARFRWAFTDKSEADRLIGQLKDTEISGSISLLLENLYALNSDLYFTMLI